MCLYYQCAHLHSSVNVFMVRRLPEETDEAGNGSIGSMAQFTKIEEVNAQADKALISILKMITDINRSKEISDYQQHRRLQQFLPGYRVRLNFALHAGWSVEGAIGSRHKLDAAYLGETVQVVMDLTNLSPLYGVPVLMTGVFHSLLSSDAQINCRLIDSVKRKSSADRVSHPISIVS